MEWYWSHIMSTSILTPSSDWTNVAFAYKMLNSVVASRIPQRKVLRTESSPKYLNKFWKLDDTTYLAYGLFLFISYLKLKIST